MTPEYKFILFTILVLVPISMLLLRWVSFYFGKFIYFLVLKLLKKRSKLRFKIIEGVSKQYYFADFLVLIGVLAIWFVLVIINMFI